MTSRGTCCLIVTMPAVDEETKLPDGQPVILARSVCSEVARFGAADLRGEAAALDSKQGRRFLSLWNLQRPLPLGMYPIRKHQMASPDESPAVQSMKNEQQAQREQRFQGRSG